MALEVVVSAGADEPRTVVITDTALQDISGCTYAVQLAPAGEEPTAAGWATATPAFTTGEGSTDTNVATIALNVNAGNATPGNDYRLCVKITDGTDVYVRTAPEVLHAA